MTEIYSTLGTVCLILGLVLLMAGIISFFYLHIPETWKELHGQTQVGWVVRRQNKERSEKSGKKKKNDLPENKRRLKIIPEDEPPTILDDGEVKQDSLVGFYEDSTITETESGISAEMKQNEAVSEEKTIMDSDAANFWKKPVIPEEDTEESAAAFVIQERIMIIHTNEQIR